MYINKKKNFFSIRCLVFPIYLVFKRLMATAGEYLLIWAGVACVKKIILHKHTTAIIDDAIVGIGDEIKKDEMG